MKLIIGHSQFHYYFSNGCPPKVNFSIQIFLYLSNEPLFIYFKFHFLSFGEDPKFNICNFGYIYMKMIVWLMNLPVSLM